MRAALSVSSCLGGHAPGHGSLRTVGGAPMLCMGQHHVFLLQRCCSGGRGSVGGLIWLSSSPSGASSRSRGPSLCAALCIR